MVVRCMLLESSWLQVSVVRNTFCSYLTSIFPINVGNVPQITTLPPPFTHTVAVQITTTLNCLTSSVAKHKLLPGDITCSPYTVTLAVDRLTYLARFSVNNSLSLSTVIIKFLITELVSIMNCTDSYHYRVANVIPVLSLVWRAGGP